MNIETLPNDYSCYFKSDIARITAPFTLNFLIKESLVCNRKAQKAVIQKLQIGLNDDVKDYSIIQRIDLLIDFWVQIKDINSKSTVFGLVWEYSIYSCIKEMVMGERLYSVNSPTPNYNDVYYGVGILEKYIDNSTLLKYINGKKYSIELINVYNNNRHIDSLCTDKE